VTLAVSLGLGTCYVGGSYNADLTSAQLRAGEKIPFLIALGYEDKGRETLIAKVGKSLTHISKKRPADILTSDVSISKIQANRPLLYTGLEAMLCAPSSMNRQPVRVQYRQGEILAKVGSGSNSDLIDLGIALFNFQAVYPGVWEWGNPARFFADDSD
jgi:nitroreductase